MPAAPTQAIILAAGKATRLRPLTLRRPKGMLLVGGKPLLQHLVETSQAVGIRKIVLVVGDHRQKIQAFFNDGTDFRIKIVYAHQQKATGTADAVRQALDQIDVKKPCLLLPGDNYLTKGGLAPLAKASGDALLLATARHSTRYGVPTLDGRRLAHITADDVEAGAGRVSTGALRAGPRLLAALSAKEFADFRDMDGFLDAYARAGERVNCTDIRGPWEDVTEPWDVLRLNETILARLKGGRTRRAEGYLATGSVQVAGEADVAPTAHLVGPVTIGQGSSIGDHSVIGPYVSIRNNTVVGAHCEVRRSILNNNVRVDSYSLVRGSILDDGVNIGSRFASQEAEGNGVMRGCIVGADAAIGADCRAASGALVPPEAKVPDGTRINTRTE